MRRIIWIGDAPKSGSVYWDTKEKKAYVGKSSSIISASGSQQNGVKVWLYTGIGIAIMTSLGLLMPRDLFKLPGNSEFSLIERIIFSVAWLAFTTTEVFLMNKFMYSDMRHLKPATLKQVQYAINSTGYLKNTNMKYTRYFAVFAIIVMVLACVFLSISLALLGVEW